MQGVALHDRVVIGDAVDRGRRDEHEPLDAVPRRALEQQPGAVDCGRRDLPRLGERQRGRRMHDGPDTVERALDRDRVADVPEPRVDAITLLVIEGRDVEGAHGHAAREQVPHQVDAEEAGAAGDQARPGAQERIGVGHRSGVVQCAARTARSALTAPARCRPPPAHARRCDRL